MVKKDSRLAEYALGILDSEACEQLERELRNSAELARELATFQQTVADLARSQSTIEPRSDLRESILSSIKIEQHLTGFADRLATFLDLPGSKIDQLLSAVKPSLADPWVDSGLPGTHFLHFNGGPRVAAADCGLVHVNPGIDFPRHRHQGDEWVFCLQGRAQEDGGELLEPGDIVYREAGSIHGFKVLGDQPFVFAAVLHVGIEMV